MDYSLLDGWDKPPYPVSQAHFTKRLVRRIKEAIIENTVNLEPGKLYKRAPEKMKRAIYNVENPETVQTRAENLLNIVNSAIVHFYKAKEDSTVNTNIIDYFIFGAKRLALLAYQDISFIQIASDKTPVKKRDIYEQMK